MLWAVVGVGEKRIELRYPASRPRHPPSVRLGHVVCNGLGAILCGSICGCSSRGQKTASRRPPAMSWGSSGLSFVPGGRGRCAWISVGEASLGTGTGPPVNQGGTGRLVGCVGQLARRRVAYSIASSRVMRRPSAIAFSTASSPIARRATCSTSHRAIAGCGRDAPVVSLRLTTAPIR